MEFNKEAKVIIDTMNHDEAEAFVKFLKSEILRHHMDINLAAELIEYCIKKFCLSGQIQEATEKLTI